MVFDHKINEVGEELNTYEIESYLVNNVISQLEEFGGLSRRNTHFIKPRYIPA